LLAHRARTVLDIAARYTDVLEHMIAEGLKMSALRTPLELSK
jgi:hypothetical protein